VFNAIKCHPISCAADSQLQKWDFTVLVLAVLWAIVVCVGRAFVDNQMRQALEQPTKENFMKLFDQMRLFDPIHGPVRATSRQVLSRPVGDEEQTALIQNGRPRVASLGFGGGGIGHR